jgi:hypothetical protein
MIIEKICVIEYSMMNNSQKDIRKKKALNVFKEAIKQIDFNSEVIPLNNYNRLVKIFESLLNRGLNQDEKVIIEYLIES